MSNVNFQKGLEKNLNAVAIQDGTICFTTDTSNLFIDVNSDRKQINANKANALTVNAGSATQPVYFSSDGVPVATTYKLEKSVPSNAVFTDTNTHYTSKNVVGATNATSNTSTALSNGAVYLNSVENGAVTSTHKISGSGVTKVTTDTSGNIIISSDHTHTVSHTPAGTVSTPTFTGSSATSGTPSGTSTVASSTHTHKYTPAGTVSQPTFTGSAVTSGASSGTTSVYSITGVGSVPSLSASVTNRCLTLTFSAGSVPTRSSVTLPSTSHTHSVTASGTVSQPSFTGTEASTTSISGTASVASSSHTHSVTAKGTISQPTFTGTAATLTTSSPTTT